MRPDKGTRVAILVPTKDRSEFIERLLNYYASVKSPHTLYIGDASQGFHLKQTKEAIARFSEHVSTVHFSWTGLSAHATMARLAEEASETYCAFLGDDDFLVPESLTKCAKFLGNNADFRTAQGRALIFALQGGSVYGSFDGHGGVYWDKKESHWATARERLFQFASGGYWGLQFSVHRRKEFIADSSISRASEDRGFSELINNFVFIGRGKSKFIDCLYLFRQTHETRYSLPTSYDWITGEKWNKSFQEMSAALEDVLVEVDGLKRDEARAVARDIVLLLLKRSIRPATPCAEKAVLSTIAERRQILLRWMRTVPVIKNSYRYLEGVLGPLTARFGRLTAPALSHSTSPYHKEFMPVFRLLTSIPEEKMAIAESGVIPDEKQRPPVGPPMR